VNPGELGRREERWAALLHPEAGKCFIFFIFASVFDGNAQKHVEAVSPFFPELTGPNFRKYQ
jgi:hypothetical protein